MTSENKKQGDEPQLTISSPPSAEELASFQLQSREYNGGVPSFVHCQTSGEWDPSISWMDATLRELDDMFGSWNTENQFIQGNNAAASGHNPITGELAVNDLAMTGAAQPYCGVDFLGLGCGTNEESDPKWDINRPSCEQLPGRVLLPLFNTSPDKTISRSSLNYSPNMANDSPGFPQPAGVHTQLRNVDPYRAQSLGQNVSGFPHQVWRANQLSNPLPMQSVEGSFQPDFNMERLSHQAPEMNRDNGVANAAWFRATRMPPPSSMVRIPQPASDQLQNPPITALRNFSPGPVMAPPFVGIAGNMSRHIQSGPVVPRSILSHGQRGPIAVPFLGALRSMPGQGQSGQAVPANTGPAVEVSQGIPFPSNIRAQHASKGFLDQSEASVSLNLLNNANTSGTPDQVIQQTIVPESLVSHSGPSHKRVAPKLASIAPAQRRKTRSTVHPSPPVPPHVPPSSLNSLKSRLLQNQALLHSLLATQSTDHIKWQEEEETSPSGYQCPICKRDLSYTPEGPMYELDKLKSTAVLPCGHYFHSSCLLRITPTDQAENPPCIPCALEG